MKIDSTPPAGFSLVEVTLALGLAGFCLVAMLGLIPAGMRNVATASEQTATVGILGSIISDLKGTPSGTATSPRFAITIPTAAGVTNVATNYFSEDGEKVASASAARYAAAITLSSDGTSSSVNAYVRIFWPAAAATNASGSVEGFTVLDRY